MEPKDLSIRDFYAKVWGEYADPQHHPITAEGLAVQRRIVARRIRDARPRRVLDLGCGPEPVVRTGAAPFVVAADLVFDMLQHIGATRDGPMVCLDARRLPFRDRCFDFLWCGLLIDHIQDPEAWIRELHRVLAPGATLGMACWRRSHLPADRYPEDARMRYTTAHGEELSVASFPTWEAAARILAARDPRTELHAFTIVPDDYVLEVAWAKVPT